MWHKVQIAFSVFAYGDLMVQHQLVKRVSFLHPMVFTPLSKISCPLMCGSNFGLCSAVLFYVPNCTPISCRFGYCSFTRALELSKISPPSKAENWNLQGLGALRGRERWGIKKMFIFERGRESIWVHEQRGAERGGDRGSEAGSVLAGLKLTNPNSQTSRSWPKSKSEA